MSSSSGGNGGENTRGSSFFVNSAKSAIKALSSGRFLTPGSPVRTKSLDDRRPEETSRDLFADGPFALGIDDVEVSGPEIAEVEESLRPNFEMPLFGQRAEMIRSFPDQGGLPEASSGFSGGILGEDEGRRSTFEALRAMHGGGIPSSQFPAHQTLGADYLRPDFRSSFVTASASAPVSRPRSPQTPPHGMGPGQLSGTCFSQDRFPSSHPRPAAVTENEFGNPVRLERNDAVVGSEFGQSVRFGRDDRHNVTQRNSKRPKERSRDKAYKTRFSMDSTTMHQFGSSDKNHPPVGGNTWPRNEQLPSSSRVEALVMGSYSPSNFPQHPMRSVNPPEPDRMGGSSSAGFGDEFAPYEIHLIFEGTMVSFRAWPTMSVMQLIMEAGRIFGIDSDEIVLVLFTAVSVSLHRDGFLFGPPRVGQGSRVMVFNVRAPGPFAHVSPHESSTRGYHAASPALPEAPISALNSKLLSTFKLPKFDGVGRSWKLWEKSFQRFLGLHQLDYVLEENFLELLWTNPGAKAANKLVFFLIEDAVAAGTLASKLVRQATKWNGHEAFVILRNGYVFSGPQTATILLAELSKISLQRDEDASSFCLRLVELIEDLELVPGDAAVYLTDTQKLGYLLSAIRHETGLQAVYSQLQSEQLRGTITFELACRELHHRVEAMKADDYMDSRPGKALISTEHKKHGQAAVPVEKVPCLAKDCLEMIQPYLPL
jgi:hypothetical protein